MHAHVHIFKAKELYRFMYDYVKRIVPYRFGGIDYYQELITNNRKECWRAKTPSQSSHQKAVPTSWDP